MSSEALLAVIGVLIALYSILPSERRLDIRLRLDRIDIGIAIACMILVHYLKYEPMLEQIGFAPSLGPYLWGFEADSTSYLLILTATAAIALRARGAPFPSFPREKRSWCVYFRWDRPPQSSWAARSIS